jgi:hypothetical protein
MIRHFLTAILLILSTYAFSQENGDSNYSFGVRGYNYIALPKTLYQSDNRRYVNSNFSSYIIKFNDNLYSYRLNGSYFNQPEHFSNSGTQASGKVKDYSFKAGFEKNFNYGVVQPYFAFDLGYRSDEFTGVLSNTAVQNIATNSTKRGFTITPVFGIKLNPVKAISIFAETNAEFFYAWGKEESANQDAAADYQRHFKKGEYLYNPVSVGIQVHLGNKN